jgi:hypothetical protein
VDFWDETTEPDWFAMLNPPRTSRSFCSRLNFLCSRTCPLKHGRHTRVAPCRTAVLGCIEAPPSSSGLTAAFAPQLLLPTRLAKLVAASLSVASAAPHRALDVVKPWKETLDHLVLLLLFFLICWTCVASALSRRICTPSQHPPDGVLHP